jgi:hypothetical protein
VFFTLVSVFYNLTNLDVRCPDTSSTPLPSTKSRALGLTVQKTNTAPPSGNILSNSKFNAGDSNGSGSQRQRGLSAWAWLALCLALLATAVIAIAVAVRNRAAMVSRAEAGIVGRCHCKGGV